MNMLCRFGWHKIVDDWRGTNCLNVYCERCDFAMSGCPVIESLPRRVRRYRHTHPGVAMTPTNISTALRIGMRHE